MDDISAGEPVTPASRTRGRTVLETFDYEGVRLLPSRFRRQVERARAVYGSIPGDDILKGFRQAAGLRHPARAWAAGAERRAR